MRFVCVTGNMALFRSDRFTCADPGIFVRGVQVRLTKKKALTTFFFFFFFFFFLVLSLFYRSQMVNFKEIYHFTSIPEGVQHCPGGGGGGGGGLFQRHIRVCTILYIGSYPPPPPLDPVKRSPNRDQL